LIMFFQLLGHENKKCFVSNIEHIQLDKSKSHRHESLSALSGTICRVRHHTDFWKFRNHNSLDAPHKVHIVHITDHSGHIPRTAHICNIYVTLMKLQKHLLSDL
jgi:hypothetical protein